MTRTYNPITRRYELDKPRDYRQPSATPAHALQDAEAKLRIANAQLDAIARCTNVKQVSVILKTR